MSTIIGRWNREAVLARLAAFNAIESAAVTPADRARRKVEALRAIAALDAGLIDTEEAIVRFGRIAREASAAVPVAA